MLLFSYSDQPKIKVVQRSCKLDRPEKSFLKYVVHTSFLIHLTHPYMFVKVLCLDNACSLVPLMYSFTKQVLTDGFLCSRQCSKDCRQSSEQNISSITWNYHNLVNQLYSNIKLKLKKMPSMYFANNNVISQNLVCISFIEIFIFIFSWSCIF